ncbi:branched-chain amino acid aminotransferase [Myroides marinus]|jgi:branched-chain amino acid aminotransferase|uniref:Branched-chain-amino-acid aminotransferase n=1 Tax=Myroides marinus TaxID=703342 RepID=A0A161S9C4_9FLAO|nr:branched-chain amino acid aminotransferase [Myroides marinus]MDR0195680.1 branched-chain amino acid aminotransferase [Myroides sp.]KUF42185.1 branched chain amino acid aminotransferase [Myroides marinus]KZE81979.1 branched chain amino acid aminotransferase [Myroides marinus]MDM1348399.1 branched-chain amino acid aminotransferase [Myroides marinus]MDM1351918.1 branched-chain amino acid aminotransferase [Myroides marinus]
MSLESNNGISIQKVETSKIASVDFENLKFGSVFTDHMLVCHYKDGKWGQVEIKPYGPMSFAPSTNVFHYGQAIFEGMKAYKDANEDVWLFRPRENWARFNKSAERMAMPHIDEERFVDGLKALINLDRDWVKQGEGNALYIRPFMIGTHEGVVAGPSSEFMFCIICSPARTYYSGKVKVQIAEHYSRAANGGVGYTKCSGNYAGQFYPTKLAQEAGYQQVIWTDDATHTKLEEAGTMNVFFRIGDTLITAPTSERILDGVTRKSLLDIAKSKGINVEVKSIVVQDLIDAHAKGELKEIFGAGTAVTVGQIEGFAFQEKYYQLPEVSDDNSFAIQLKTGLQGIQQKKIEDTFGWTEKI